MPHDLEPAGDDVTSHNPTRLRQAFNWARITQKAEPRPGPGEPGLSTSATSRETLR
jgi:hypothetical protein